MVEFILRYNDTIAATSFLLLGIVTIIVMIPSEWERRTDWWVNK